MSKQISASDAKNNFGGLLEDVAELGRVDIVRHGRLVAVVLAPRVFEASLAGAVGSNAKENWDSRHMIPAQSAREAHMIGTSGNFDDD